MDKRLELLKEKTKDRSNKSYYSLTSDEPEKLDEIDSIIEKYSKQFLELGVSIRIKDRR